jgi:chromosome segregation ATPase
VSKSLNQAIETLKKQIEAISGDSPRDRSRKESLKRAIAVLADLTKEIKLAVATMPAKAGQTVVRNRVTGSPEDLVNVRAYYARNRQLTEAIPNQTGENRAEIEKLRAAVKQLKGELAVKAKELEAAQGRLAKLEGVTLHLRTTRMPAEVKLAEIDLNVGDIKKLPQVKHEVRTVIVAPGDSKSKLVVVPDNVDPKVITLHTDHPAVVVPDNVDPTSNAKKGTIERRYTVVRDTKPQVKTEQQRIEELEKKLKGLLEELNSLKKDHSQVKDK